MESGRAMIQSSIKPDERKERKMEKQTFGNMVAALRKEKGMTQLELAEKMGVTDKAVSKWERDLSFPDIQSIPRLAEIFHVTIDELIQAKSETKEAAQGNFSKIVPLTLKAVALAMGVAVAVLSAMDQVEIKAAVGMLGIGVACLAAVQLSKTEK